MVLPEKKTNNRLFPRERQETTESALVESVTLYDYERGRVKQSKACSCTVHKKLMLEFFIVFWVVVCVTASFSFWSWFCLAAKSGPLLLGFVPLSLM